MRETIVFDFDGTLVNTDTITHLWGDWDAFHAATFDCEAREGVVELAKRCQTIMQVIVLTGKPERFRMKLQNWLSVRGIIPDELLMRPDKSMTSDAELKPQLLFDLGIGQDDIIAVIEDRDKMVDRWRSLGFLCLQAAPCIETKIKKEGMPVGQ